VNWPGHGPYSDVPCDLAIACVQAAGKNWADLDGKARQSAELGIKVKLNTKAVERMTPDLLTQSDPQSVLRNFLRQVGTALNA
jgi:hypothetical protein